MSEATPSTSWYSDYAQSLSSAMNGKSSPRWSTIRSGALAAFESVGFPTARDEAWKYTNIRSLAKERFAFAGLDVQLDNYDLSEYLLDQGPCSTLVVANGTPVLEGFQAPKEVVLFRLHEVLADQKHELHNWVSECFESSLERGDHAIELLNAALASDGLVLHVRAGARIEQPLHLVHLVSPTEAPVSVHNRLFVSLEAGAELTVVESFCGPSDYRYFVTALDNFQVAADAKLRQIKLQREGSAATHIGVTRARQEDRSRFESLVIHIGGQLVRNEIHPVLDGEEIDCRLLGLSALKDSQHVDNNTVIDHTQPNSESFELYKGLYGDRSRGVFSGTIIVRQDAQKTNAIQSNQSILLSPDAAVDTRPQLKIWADDVKCTHGATVGQFDEDALFYLRSRGVSKADAERILMRAFLSDIFDDFAPGWLGDELLAIVLARLDAIESNS